MKDFVLKERVAASKYANKVLNSYRYETNLGKGKEMRVFAGLAMSSFRWWLIRESDFLRRCYLFLEGTHSGSIKQELENALVQVEDRWEKNTIEEMLFTLHATPTFKRKDNNVPFYLW